MVNDFLKRLGQATGKTYSPKEFGKICIDCAKLAEEGQDLETEEIEPEGLVQQPDDNNKTTKPDKGKEK